MKLAQVVLLGVFATSVYLQGCGGEGTIYTSTEEALAAICPSSTVCTEYCTSCVQCTMSTATDSNPATSSSYLPFLDCLHGVLHFVRAMHDEHGHRQQPCHTFLAGVMWMESEGR
eukprot:s1156_g5.t1